MRIRTIKPEFFKHDGVAALPALTRILFQGLWCLADSEGRLEDRPARIRVEVLPYDKCNVEEMLSELAKRGFIHRYKADGLKLIQVAAFKRHQRITGKESETPSRFPEMKPGQDGEQAGKQSGNNWETPETTGNGRETEGNEERKGNESASAGDCSIPPSLGSVKAEFAAKGMPGEAEKFMAFYESKGWLVGKNKMKSWKGAVAGWAIRAKESPQLGLASPTAKPVKTMADRICEDMLR